MTIAVEIGYTYGFVDYGPDHQKENIRLKDISSIDVFEIAHVYDAALTFSCFFAVAVLQYKRTKKRKRSGGYDRTGNNAAGENVYG